MEYNTAAIRSEILAARSSFSQWKAFPESVRSIYLDELHAAGRKVNRLEIAVSCDLCAAEADCKSANAAVDILGYEKAMARYKAVLLLAHEIGIGPTPADSGPMPRCGDGPTSV